jgi:hypothetical protein
LSESVPGAFGVRRLVAFKWEVAEPHSDKAIRLREDFQKGIQQLSAPEFFPFELAHALTRAERQGRIAVGQARLFWTDAMTSAPALLATALPDRRDAGPTSPALELH